jgi:hypothetical protein
MSNTTFQIVEENNYMSRPFSGWAIIRLRLEYRRKLIYSYTHPEDGPPRKGPKHVVVFFNNLKIRLCYDGHLYTQFLLRIVLNHTTGMMPPKMCFNFLYDF